MFYMKRITITFCAAAFLFACNSEDKKAADNKTEEAKVASASTTTPSNSNDWVAVDSATAEKAWMAYMTPGEAHKMLAEADGEWTDEITMWMEEGGQPMTSKGVANNKMILGGRYQISNHKGSFMGQSFEGMSMVAYDNAKKKYISTWVDNMGTGVMNMEGEWNEAAKAIEFKGKMICPANGKECDVRETYQIIDKDTHLMTMYGPDLKTGKEYKNMQIKFTRKA